MKKILEIALGIVTSVGGFLEIGSIATAAQAGSDFSFQPIVIGLPVTFVTFCHPLAALRF